MPLGNHVEAESDNEAPGNAQEQPVNWLNIIRFHKDVIEKAEENVFALPIWRQDDDRWSCIDGDHIHDLIGEWTIPAESLRSQSFKDMLAGQQAQSIYLGGACYVVSKPMNQNWVPTFWVPVIYKEVEVVVQDDRIHVKPKETGWNITPQVLGRCGNVDETAPDILRAAVTRLCDAIKDIGVGTPLHQAVLDVLFAETKREYPIGSVPNNDQVPEHKRLPTPWVLFVPPQEAGNMTRNLMRDYNKLDKALQTNASPGGMQILTGGHPPFERAQNSELVSPLPLTKSQRRAVNAVVNTDNPLTVVSGPPGTGKSQVVAAVLADCWRRGRSVLFTSTNNKAVNVVKERVDDVFGFPMVVRSGNPHHAEANVDTVDKLSNMLTQLALLENDEDDTENHPEKLKDFQQQREQLLQVIESEAPQRILEERHGAREEYAQCRKIEQELEAILYDYKQKMSPYDPETTSVAAMRESLALHKEWIQRYSNECVPKCNEAVAEQRRLVGAIQERIATIANCLEKAGSEAEADEDTRILQPGAPGEVFAWKAALFQHLTEYESFWGSKPEWHAEYDRLTDATDARQLHRQMMEHAESIGEESDRQKIDIQSIEGAEENLLLARKKLLSHGVPDGDYKQDHYLQWRDSYIQYRQMPVCFADKLFRAIPIYKTAKIKAFKSLISKEALMLAELPSACWPTPMQNIQDTESRKKLLEVVEAVMGYIKRIGERERLAEKREAIRRRHREICAMAECIDINAQSFQDSEVNCELYLEWIRLAKQRAEYARQAAVALESRANIKRATGILRKDLYFWDHIHLNNSFFTGGSTLPEQLGDMLRQCLSSDDGPVRVELILQAKGIIQDVEPWGILQNRMEQILEYYGSIDQYKEQIAAIQQPDALRLEWFNSLPPSALRIWTTLESIHPVDAHELSGKVGNLETHLDAFEVYNLGERISRTAEAEGHKHASMLRFEELISKLPDPAMRDQVRQAVHREVSDNVDSTNTLDSLLAEVDPQIIGQKLKNLDREIMETWLAMAKREWWQRSRQMVTGAPLTQIRNAFQAVHNGLLPEDAYGSFKAALPTATCWVSTALSSMSIPMLPELFDLVMIDEASQCSVTNILPFSYRAKRLVIIGDSMQLKAIPVVTVAQEAELAEKHGLSDYEASQYAHTGNTEWNVYAAGESALPAGATDVQMLLDHFRCHPAIISFSNRYIYNKALKLCKYPNSAPLPCAPGVNVIDVPDGVAVRGAKNVSWYNVAEATAIRDLVLQLLSKGKEKSIGIITTFKGQKARIQSLLKDEIHLHDILVDTAHGFQGDERDIIIYSPVVSEHNMQRGTLNWVGAEPNLVNVAVTRARDAFFFVGNVSFCASLPQEPNPSYIGLLARYCDQIQKMRDGGSPIEVELYGWMMMRDWGHEVRVHHTVPGIDQEMDFFIHRNGRSVSIEVDGQQAHQNRRGTDAARDAVLRANGITPLRFTASQIHKMPFNVIKRIEDEIGH